jgi:hypothetical protein
MKQKPKIFSSVGLQTRAFGIWLLTLCTFATIGVSTVRAQPTQPAARPEARPPARKAAVEARAATSETPAAARGSSADSAPLAADSVPAGTEKTIDTPEEMTPTARPTPLHHKHQVGVEIGFGWGYRFIKPYGDIWCGERDDGDNAAFCLSSAPAFMDVGLSFGLTRRIDLITDFRYGLLKDEVSGRNPLMLMAGVRFWIDPDAAFKWAFGLQLMMDFTKQDGEKQQRVDYKAPKQDAFDVGGRFYGEIHYDLLKYVGFYIRLAGTVGALRWLRFELEGLGGVQARFP